MQQLNLPKSSGWGGQRKGAGRKAQRKKPLQNHVRRESFRQNTPLHVTVKLCKGLKGLRSRRGFQLLRFASLKAKNKGLRIIQFSLQSNHIHLIVEAHNIQTLSKGMQAFCISFSKRFNSWKNRQGKVFFDRYHLHILKTLNEVKNALKYVLLNSSKHRKSHYFLDIYSSAPHFFDWMPLIGKKINIQSQMRPKQWVNMDLILCEVLDQPRSWALQSGWILRV